MKIKKVAPSAGTLATVSNLPADSQKDTYSCDYLNKRTVIVSSEEPTTGEEVWIEKYNNIMTEIEAGNIDTDTGENHAYYQFMRIIDFIEVENSTPYYMSYKLDKETGAQIAVYEYDADKKYLGFSYQNSTSILFTTKTNTKYVRARFKETSLNINPYLAKNIKKIHTKNDNGYDEFYNEENREVYSTSEQRIGTWLGKPLYRKAGTYATFISKGTLTVLTSVGSNVIDRVVKFNVMCRVSSTYYNKNQDTSIYVSTGNFCITPTQDIGEVDYVIEYTKSTD